MDDNQALEWMLSLAPGAVLSGFIIIYLYGRGISPGRLKHSDCALIALCVYVMGNTLDEMYWMPFWALSYFGVHKDTIDILMDHGPYANLVFREAVTFIGLCLLYIAIIKSASSSGLLEEAEKMKKYFYLTIFAIVVLTVTTKTTINVLTST